MKNIFLFFISLALLSSQAVFSQAKANDTQLPVVDELRTEYLKDPVGIDVQQPRFSWKMRSGKRAVWQTSYQIKVTTDKEGKLIVWDSGRTYDDRSVHIIYQGPALLPSTRYYWQVDVWDNAVNRISSTETAFFETGLLDSGWSGAQWIKVAEKAEAERYTLQMDFQIIHAAAGIIFAAKDKNNFYMWQINTEKEKGKTYFRPHVWRNGSVSVLEEKDITSIVNIEENTVYTLRIEADKDVVTTYIDDRQIDARTNPYNENYGCGMIGFRAAGAEKSPESETALFDNIILTKYENGQPIMALSEDFENTTNRFDAETVSVGSNTRIKVYARNGEIRIFDNSAQGIPLFRTEIAIDKQVERARIYTSAMGVYDVFINGQRVGTPVGDRSMVYDEMKPGWTDYYKTVFYSTYDVTGLLTKGENAIGAQVSSGWWQGAIANGKYGSPSLGFIAKLLVEYTDGTSATFVTNTRRWKSSTDGPVRIGEIYAGEDYDARMESAWTSAGFDDAGWRQTTLHTEFTGEIKAFIGPPVQVRPELERTPIGITKYDGIIQTGTTYGAINVKETWQSAPASISLRKGETLIYDMGQNMVGWVKFKVKGDAGAKMKIRFAEMLNDNGDASRANDGPGGSLYTIALRDARATLHYTLKGSTEGETFRPSTTFFGFRYCEISAIDDISIESLAGEVVGTVAEEGSTFITSNKAVNQLYQNIMWGQRGNFLSIPTDCPQRNERLGWAGDIQVFGRAATYNADLAAFFHKWMGDMRDSQREDGAYPDVAPHAWVGWGQAAWAEAGLVIPWNVYLMYGDKGILEENFESMERYMSFLANQATDKYLYNGAGNAYGDWLSFEATESRYVSVCYYAYAALLMEKISKAMSHTPGDVYAEKSTHYNTLYHNIKNEFRRRYVNSDGSLKQKSQTAYLLALKLDLLPDAEATKKGLEFLNRKIEDNGNKLSTGFVGTGIINQTLSDVGSVNTAYNLLLQRDNPSWLYSVDQGATTVWERWNSYTKENGFNPNISMNSFNHYAYGAVSEWMYRYMAGINPDEKEPGFKHIIISPSPDFRTHIPAGQERITSIEATYNSYYGKIRSTWNMEDNETIVYEISIPANTSATVVLPAGKRDKIKEGETPLKKAEGISSVKREKDKVIITLQSGKYKISF